MASRDPYKEIMRKRQTKNPPKIPIPLICPHCSNEIKGVSVIIASVVVEYPKSQKELIQDARRARSTRRFNA